MARKSGSIRRDDPYPNFSRPHLTLVKDSPDSSVEQTGNVRFEGGVLHIDNPDGTTTIDFDPHPSMLPGAKKHDTSSDENLALEMSEDQLGKIASELLDGVQRDELSRKEWLETRALGIELLGLKLEKPRQDQGASSAPLEGMSTVRHPLLLEAVVSFQATARGELLPASGPVKVRNDTPTTPRHILATADQANPDAAYPSHPPPQVVASADEQAQALEQDLNHYLTAVATEYVPDTDRMLFYVGFGGDGFKKVYNCPLRMRPVSESVDAEDLIVSNSATDLNNCGRITHRIKMRKSILRRMQILGVYRDVDLSPPTIKATNPVEQKKDQIAGYNPSMAHSEDRDYEILEIYCELDLDEFAPKQFKNKGLELPYRVTIERQSRQILDVRKNWEDKDKLAQAKKYFVQFPMVRGLGFYGLGYIHLLGNTAIALTAAWRLQLDNGMFSNFPGFLYSKGIGRQLSNQFRVPPGGGVGLEIGTQQSIKDAVMPLPYKETGPSFAAFTKEVQESGRRLGQTATINVGEGKQDAPVGTTLALIEQATKVMDSAHKRLHAAQGEEFKLLVDRIREDPKSFIKALKMEKKWQVSQLLEALDNYNIVPVADPNNPTSLHRMAKAMAIKELQKGSPDLYDPVAVDMRVMQIADIDPQGLFRQVPKSPPPDPRMEAIKEKSAASDRQNQIQLMEAQIKSQTAAAQMQDKAQDRASRERLEQMKIQLELMKIREEQIIHQQQMHTDIQQAHHKMALDAAGQQQKLRMEHANQQQKMALDAHAKVGEAKNNHMAQQVNMYSDAMKNTADIRQQHQQHQAEMARDAQKHVQTMQHDRERHAVELETAKKMAAVTKKENSGKDKAKPKKGNK